MPPRVIYLVLIENEEVELAGEEEVRSALASGRIEPESWIKEQDAESAWQMVEEMFPELAKGP